MSQTRPPLDISGLVLPNLDTPDAYELQLFASLFAKLSAFCMLRAKAKTARLEGDILDALTLERAAETLYQKLPRKLRW
jgi:hypothetical protein